MEVSMLNENTFGQINAPFCLSVVTFSFCTINNCEVFYFIIIFFLLSLEEPEIAFAIIDSRSEGGYTEPMGSFLLSVVGVHIRIDKI